MVPFGFFVYKGHLLGISQRCGCMMYGSKKQLGYVNRWAGQMVDKLHVHNQQLWFLAPSQKVTVENVKGFCNGFSWVFTKEFSWGLAKDVVA